MKKTLLAASLVFVSSMAFAASTVVVSSPVADNARISSTIEVFNIDTIRIHVGTAPDYLLLLNGRIHSIQNQQSSDMSELRDQIRLPTIGDENIALLHGLEDAGKEEIVAGIKGAVYTIRYTDEGSQIHQEEVVLSSDARVRENTLAWKSYLNHLPQRPSGGRDVFQNFLDSKNLGVLRFANNYRVESFGVSPAADRFVLPPSR
jgi:hypothetical protein